MVEPVASCGFSGCSMLRTHNVIDTGAPATSVEMEWVWSSRREGRQVSTLPASRSSSVDHIEHDVAGSIPCMDSEDEEYKDMGLLNPASPPPSTDESGHVQHVPDVDIGHVSETSNDKAQPVSWSSLPRKDQLLLLAFARLSEPLTQTSLHAYMYYQLKSFDRALPAATISYQVGLLQAAFTGAQFCTAFLWGRIADSERMGRKRVILVGLVGTSVGALGFGFSQTFYTALFWRALGGALNGNVGVMRTMIGEIIKEKKYQSRAFLLLPMTFNIGVIIGPVLGGLLADPVMSFPRIFGENSIFGGQDGVWWMKEWPYALPNIFTAAFMTVSASVVILGMEETLETLKNKRDYGLRLGDLLKRHVFRRRPQSYQLVPDADSPIEDIEMRPATKAVHPKQRGKLPFRRIWTYNVVATLVAHGMLACHLGTFSSLWFIFLSTPRWVPPSANPSSKSDPNSSLHLPSDYHPKPPLVFTGGLGLPPAAIGTSLAILGVIGISLQLILYPRISFRFGTVPCYRISLLVFPLVYMAMPFLAQVPSSSPSPQPASGVAFWMALILVLATQVLARTFALPGTAILINNACPHPSVLGTIHGLGQSVSSLMRTVGPIGAGLSYGAGLRAGVVGAVFWGMAGWALLGFFAGQRVRDGDGHEIFLEGEQEDEINGRK